MDLSLLKDWADRGLARPDTFGGKSGWRLTPSEAPQVAELLHGLQAHGLRVSLRAMDAPSLGLPLWLDMRGLNRVRRHEPEDFIVSVETGTSWGSLLQALAPHDQAPALRYPEAEPLLEALAEDRPALETGLRGYLRDLVLKVEIAGPDGQVTVSGADVVKNVTGYDLNKLYIGGRHAYGVITAVTLKLAPQAESVQGLQWTAERLADAQAWAEALLASDLPLAACELASPARQGGGVGWLLYAELAGEAPVLNASRPALQGLALPPPRRPDGRETGVLRGTLQTWPPEAWVAEIALPRQAAGSFCQDLPADIRAQVRPAAGLVYVLLDSPDPGADALAERAREAGGFLQWVHTPYYHPDLVRRHNLPSDPVVRSLHQRLKSGFDPAGTLFTPLLPFDGPGLNAGGAHVP